jgi:2-iminobutanoate/2-iminopropanoate deaminase
MMQKRSVAAETAPVTIGNYAQAVEVVGAMRQVYVSGQIPVDSAGTVPADFAGQARLVWANVVAQLAAAGLGLDHLVKVTIYLSDRRYADENRAIRKEVLAGREVALTCIITGIFDQAWLLEIEAIAAA